MNTSFTTPFRYGLLAVALVAALGGCIEPPDFDNTPEISSPVVRKETIPDDFSPGTFKDSVIVSIRFQDGDGDLGVTSREREDTSVTYKEWGNYELTTLRLTSRGTYEPLSLTENRRLFFPRLKRDNKPGPLEGTLDFSQTFPYTRRTQLTPVKFRIRIRDRAMRTSNAIETDTIRVPLLP